MLGGARKVRKAPQLMTGQLARLDSDGPTLLLLAGLDTGLLDTRPGSPACSSAACVELVRSGPTARPPLSPRLTLPGSSCRASTTRV